MLLSKRLRNHLLKIVLRHLIKYIGHIVLFGPLEDLFQVDFLAIGKVLPRLEHGLLDHFDVLLAGHVGRLLLGLLF